MPREQDGILASQGWVVIEIDRAKQYREGEDGLLHFRVRNLQESAGRLSMRLEIPGVSLHREEQTIRLQAGGVHDIRFPLYAERPGEKLVEALDVRFELGGEAHRLVLPDHSTTIKVARRDHKRDGDIKLENVTFDFRDHVGDVSIQELIAKQDAAHPSASDEDWQALQLISRPLDGHIVIQPPRRQGLRDLCLVGPESSAGHALRIFLFARRELCFGLKSRKGDLKIPLVLRRLPCRSRESDGDNWYRNTLISQLHGRLALHDDIVCVRDESSNGTRLGKSQLTRGTWEDLGRSFKLEVPASGDVLELRGRLHYPRRPGQELALGLPARASMGEGFDVGAEHPHVVDALSLRRDGNCEEHQYVQVFRAATVGTSKSSAIRIEGRGIAERHAEIVIYEGEWFIRSKTPQGTTEVNGYPVFGEEYVSLAPGKSLTLGSLDFDIKSATPGLMTDV